MPDVGFRGDVGVGVSNNGVEIVWAGTPFTFPSFCGGQGDTSLELLLDETLTMSDGSGAVAQYGNDLDCVWRVSTRVMDADLVAAITLRFKAFELETDSDWLLVFSGSDADVESATPLYQLTGTGPAAATALEVPGDGLTLRLYTDGNVRGEGFELQMTVVVEDVLAPEPGSDNSTLMVIIIVVLLGALLIFSLSFWRYRRKLSRKVRIMEAELNLSPEQMEAVYKVMGIMGDEAQFIVDQISFDSLTMERQIGKGAFGEVWVAAYRGAPCAVKRMRKERVNTAELKVFRNEIMLMQRFRHPNIVQFFGACWEPPHIFMVLEYMDRGGLDSVLRDPSLTLTWREPKLHIATSVARAMVYLHSRDPPVIHRDIKSANILLNTAFGVRVADFGVSREEIDSTMTMVGTKSWAAPEVAAGSLYNTQCDVYSYGILLMAMGAPRGSLKAYETPHEPVFARAMRSGITPDLSSDSPCGHDLYTCVGMPDLVRACTRVNPDDRPNFAEVLEVLQHITNVFNEAVAPRTRDVELMPSIDALINKRHH